MNLRPGRILKILVSAFLAFDGAARIIGVTPYAAATARYDFAPELAPWIGAALLASTMLNVFRRTALVGAVLLTGYLGGAIATSLRVADPWLFPLALGAIIWISLVMRRPELKAVLFSLPVGREPNAERARGGPT